MLHQRFSEARKMRGTFGQIISPVINEVTPKQSFLIVCEGEATEPEYFEGFRIKSVIVRGLGCNTESLVDQAIKLKNNKYPGRDQYWCVFDRDSFPAQSFNNALAKARQSGFQVAYSNEAFELWYLLHFDYLTSGLARRLYSEKLEGHLKHKYQKNSESMYEELFNKQETAIKNATTLLESYGSAHNPEKDNPCTTVHLLVKELRAQL